MNKCIKGGAAIILGVGDDPRTKDLTDYKKEKLGYKRNTLKKKSFKRKSLKKKKSLRKRK
jgi:hypothetical protein